MPAPATAEESYASLDAPRADASEQSLSATAAPACVSDLQEEPESSGGQGRMAALRDVSDACGGPAPGHHRMVSTMGSPNAAPSGVWGVWLVGAGQVLR